MRVPQVCAAETGGGASVRAAVCADRREDVSSAADGSENGIIPYQLHRLELRKILDNASAYLPFLLEEDEDGISVREKIEAVFSFRVPYYVGPLKGRWAERTEEAKRTGEKAYPWNFEKVVDSTRVRRPF